MSENPPEAVHLNWMLTGDCSLTEEWKLSHAIPGTGRGDVETSSWCWVGAWGGLGLEMGWRQVGPGPEESANPSCGIFLCSKQRSFVVCTFLFSTDFLVSCCKIAFHRKIGNYCFIPS